MRGARGDLPHLFGRRERPDHGGHRHPPLTVTKIDDLTCLQHVCQMNGRCTTMAKKKDKKDKDKKKKGGKKK